MGEGVVKGQKMDQLEMLLITKYGDREFIEDFPSAV